MQRIKLEGQKYGELEVQVKIAIENIREIIEEIIPEYESVVRHYEAIPILIAGIKVDMPEPHKSQLLKSLSLCS